ncbi:L,D-transpeptidase family protein [Prosthecobacter sp.]|uniref:L,D-transpeptidase family protein n=1 Tax=Prosthecobacter sp. TaxID=1965333 RepID=UPI002ABA7389|nr:L,D-transpeptidase family protein [Prosthecobacter sp.]MDZ4403240.1 L,D-transpeptidase family protein [Prosthecobacter sp.]
MLFFSRTSQNSQPTARLLKVGAFVLLTGLLSQCTSSPKGDVVVSVKEQKLGIYSQGKLTKQYVISTSKFGLGDQKGSYRTPVGQHEIIAKIGQGLPAGAVLKSRRWNGEVLKPNAPGRDPIVSRILWLKGTEKATKNAANRFIYIHGTTEECRLGTPASYGCVRMGMKDVVDLFNNVNIGAKVVITKGGLPRDEKAAEAVYADDGSPSLMAPVTGAQPLEIAKLVPTAGEKKRAEENEAKAKQKAGPEKPVAKPKSKSHSDTKVAGQSSSKSKAKA